MKIFEDAEEYFKIQEWSQKQIEKLGYAGATKLREIIDRAIKRGLPSKKFKEVDIDKLEGMSTILTLELNNRRIKDQKDYEFSRKQRLNRSKKKTHKGRTPEELSERDQRMFEHFKKTNLKPNSFAKRHHTKYDVSIDRARHILSKYILSKEVGH